MKLDLTRNVAGGVFLRLCRHAAFSPFQQRLTTLHLGLSSVTGFVVGNILHQPLSCAFLGDGYGLIHSLYGVSSNNADRFGVFLWYSLCHRSLWRHFRRALQPMYHHILCRLSKLPTCKGSQVNFSVLTLLLRSDQVQIHICPNSRRVSRKLGDLYRVEGIACPM